ncbi:hypothetical protein P153DRAFT_296045 [Dothidotthia symphoricarpi CBS 119687]|uniref:C2H2-type domain-containing protein n=1 Tax=Dothidotthia symphoricarpi CBS 119687 TaxID=1392245 RepID=A0A6A6A5I5_9PLEO|nr:uncharacterized protein P153DRAFT_296045 [Dothidotthia symphoricarpi CBS 119687]KAF2127070.1 hypothetical protein P153DRAFT_296045 [Dothidotthia symphoricarpi CBS 119687]
MLASPSRRQHLPQQHHTSTSTIPTPHSQQHFSYQPSPQQFAVPHYYDQKLLHDYLDSQQQSCGAPTVSIAPNPFMTTSYSNFPNPAIRIQHSTPTPQTPSNGFTQTPMLSMNVAGSGLESWNSYNNMQSQSLQTPTQHHTKGHNRASSSSSIGSNASQYQVAGPAASYQTFSNHLPTPTQTPTQDSFATQNGFGNYTPNTDNMDQTMAAHMSMKQALMDQGDDVPEFAHSARQSVSSFGQDSPATPQTTLGDDMDFKQPVNGKTIQQIDSLPFNQCCTDESDTETRQVIVPKFERTYTDIAADNFYDPNAVAAQPETLSKPSRSSLLSPYRSNTNENVQRALQAAQYARSHSPGSQASRGDSPFRRGSPYRQANSNFNSPIVGTAAATREQSRQADAAYAMKSQMRSNGDSQPETISPKDALLDYREADEDSKVPLFSDSGATEYDGQYNGGDQYRNATQSSFDTPSAQSFRRDSWATPQFSPNFPSSSAQSIPASSGFSFVAPSVQSTVPSLPMASTSQYRVAPNNMPATVDQTPEFPAHLTSMESSASEAEPPTGSQSSINERFLHKPASSGADTGTYSCTYHGCSQRFETPQKLQKHKREGHRNANLGPSMTSAAILERNTQAGPHKCERTNPTTGKPCNTIFSRPYDLTRHEDTIHNARKQKVRCALCVEEKTFSRNDALTRHMRVVHPEIDFPGKHRRRGGNHD